MPKLKPGTVIPTPAEDAAITAAAMQDPDCRPYTDEEWAKRPTAMKILALDIDGVLNSKRSKQAFDGLPHDFSPDGMARFDHVAVALVRRLCRETGCKVLLSSSWRHQCSVDTVATALDLPVIDRTPTEGHPTRGHEIAAWLGAHPEVTHYAIVDDIGPMLPEQAPHFVQTDEAHGLTLADYYRLLTILTDDDCAVAAGANCPSCDSRKVTSAWLDDQLEYGTGPDRVELPVRIPVQTCAECGQQWTNHDAEIIRERAVQDHRKLQPSTKPTIPQLQTVVKLAEELAARYFAAPELAGLASIYGTDLVVTLHKKGVLWGK